MRESRLAALALLAALAGGALILLRILPHLQLLFAAFRAFAADCGLEGYYFTLVLKCIGIAYLAEFTAELCRDAAQGALALKVQLAGKLSVLLLALPLLAAVTATVAGLL
ncbi:MAG: stage III sporulation protein AD [Firmicutes bacterium]|nr:stage III sporulation protein AD [Bacillota bacterium]MBR7113153.1 stage III sporulation protein AD [Bacillota bacterium]